MSLPAEIDKLRRRLDADPADDEARAELAHILAREGDREGAAEAYYLAACGARRRGDEALFRERVRRCLEADPAYPLVFTGPPSPATAAGEAWARILVAHPESRVRGPIVRLLSDRGFTVEEAATAGSARAALRQAPADLVLTAPGIVDGDALAVATAARRARASAAVILLSCAAKSERIESPAELGPLVDEHLDRPLPPDRLLEAIKAALWRHRHAAAVTVAAPRPVPAAPDWRGALPRAALIVIAGYTVIFLLHSTLESIREAGAGTRAAQAAAAAAPPAIVPRELDWDSERALWIELTTEQTSRELQVAVTVLEPRLVAARIYRAARAAAGAPPGTGDVEDALDRLDRERLVSLEVNIAAAGDIEIDAAAVAASLRLRASDRPEVAPAWTQPPREMRFVREARPGQPPRTRALTFLAAFPRAALGDASVYALTLTAGGKEVLVFVPAPSRRG